VKGVQPTTPEIEQPPEPMDRFGHCDLWLEIDWQADDCNSTSSTESKQTPRGARHGSTAIFAPMNLGCPVVSSLQRLPLASLQSRRPARR
jgi:hypothetical protein